MRQFNHQFLPFFALLLLLASCAQIVTPSGGDKDITPPFAYDTAAVPPNFSPNFEGDKIVIPFNEYINLKDPRNQVIISPPFEVAPDIRVKNKSIIIELNEAPRENTTYTFNFGASIEDITERNPASNFKYVFSTGPELDSLVYAGYVYNAFSLKPEKEVFVMLYENTADSIPLLEKPSYFAKTDESGVFAINYLKPGNYKVFVLKDINANFLFDLPTEAVAFQDSLITPYIPKNDTNQVIPKFYLFNEDNNFQFVKKSTVKAPGEVVIEMNKWSENTAVRIVDLPADAPKIYSRVATHGDSIQLWVNEWPEDTLFLEVKDDTAFVDTIGINLVTEPLEEGAKKPTLTMASNAKPYFDLHKDFVVRFNHPIDSFDASKLTFIEDSIPKQVTMEPTDSTKRAYAIKYPWKEELVYDIVLDSAAFIDIYGLASDSLVDGFRTQRENYYGDLKFKVKLPNQDHQYILEFLSANGSMIQKLTLKEDQVLNFPNLGPGNYQFKLIFDRNNNGVWDTGNYLQHLQPETQLYYSEVIEVRSNWDQELEWVIPPEALK